ncbi:MAG: 3,4-dihydroxy-2-butanone-4-phosphate synthase [Luteibaculaceae bacterium]
MQSTEQAIKLNTIAEAIEDIKNGKVVIVVDDENRENEGDFVAAAEMVTPEMVNFMATHGRGLICAPLIEDRCNELGLELMVPTNSAMFETPFTVSVDLIGHGCSTGISAQDRAKTIKALIDPTIKPHELGKPGHIFPLRAKKGGVLRRPGHTEAAIDLAKLAGLAPAGVIVEIMNDDGTMARLPDLVKIAERFNLKLISIADLITFRLQNESLIEKQASLELSDKWKGFSLHVYKQTTTNEEHFALVKGSWTPDEPVLVRVVSESILEDLLSALAPESRGNLPKAINKIDEAGKGIILFMHQKKELSLADKINALKKELGSTNITGEDILVKAAKMDARDYGVGAQILRNLGCNKIRLLSNNAIKRSNIPGYGLEIVESVQL